jgi:hypothetical protein
LKVTGILTSEEAPDLTRSLQALRTKKVPRYLFKTWTAPTAPPVIGPNGRPIPATICTKENLIPAGFISYLNDRNVHTVDGLPFYDQSEASLLSLINAHIAGSNAQHTQFSIWSASLLGTLFQAAKLGRDQKKGIYITMVDTKHLDGGALIWHSQDLVGEKGSIHEYLAHGPVRGKGFKTAAWKQLVENGLPNLAPILQRKSDLTYGQDVRQHFFWEPPTTIEPQDVALARQIGELFGDLRVPATIILLAMQPRKINRANTQAKYTALCDVLRGLGSDKGVIAQLAEEYWLSTSDRDVRVYTDHECADIKEWMDLIYALACAIKIAVAI